MYLVRAREAYSSVTQEELATLEWCAQDKSVVVELGVYEGRTSRALREVMAPQGTLWLIDPFVPGALGINWQRLVATAEISRSRRGNVRYLRQMSWDAAKTWRGEFDFLFIDADHSYEAVKRDWETWAPFAAPGGLIALHDSCCEAPRCKPTDGPVRLVQEILATDGAFELVRQVHSLTVFRRRTAE
jgi:predicted O-methyltransferase YrrM